MSHPNPNSKGETMKIKNSTPYADYYLRRLVSWVCREISLPVRKVKIVEYRNRNQDQYFSGHASSVMRIVCSVPSGDDVELTCRTGHLQSTRQSIADKTEGIVVITAHELAHLHQYLFKRSRKLKKKWGATENDAELIAWRVLRAFRDDRKSLEEAWNSLPTIKPVVSLQERRAAKAMAALNSWEQKAKLAKTKVKKYRQQVKYYEPALAAKRGN